MPQENRNETDSTSLSAAVLWQKPSGAYINWAFTPGGRYFTTVSPGGGVSLFHNSSLLKFRVHIDGVDRAISSPDGTMTMVYTYLNPKRTIVRFLDLNGKIISTLDVNGSVWCADSWESNGELRFAIGTGHRQIYCISFSESGRNYVRWRTPGVVVSVSFEPDGDNLLYGTWQKSFLLRSTRRGTVRWSTTVDPAALPEVASLGDGSKWRILIVPNRQGSDAQLRMMDDECNQLWEETVKAPDRSKVLISNAGEHCCIGYGKQIVHSGKAIVENHAVLLDRNGNMLWDKGTMFLHLNPLAVADDGTVLACGTGGKLLLVDKDGIVTESETLGGDVLNSMWSPSAGRVLVNCTDGNMYMLGLNTVK